MQHFHADAFAALSPAKAKAQALALFDAAMIEPAADWRGVAFALHSVVSRKRGKVAAGEDTGDIADAGEFAAWADYAPTGKGTAIARGRVTVTFADGWSKTVGMLAGKTAKGRKPWSIAHAVRFAVICYKLAAARRATGSDAVMYFDRGGNASGESVTLDALIACPEIVSVVSADSAETVDGDLIWNPCEANAATLDLRAGAVAVPLALAPMPAHIADELKESRHALLIEMGLVRSTVRELSRAAYDRVCASLYPAAHVETIYSAPDEFFAMAWGDDADAYPMAGAPAEDERAAACLSRAALVEAASEAIAMGEDVADVTDEPEPASDTGPADLETMTLASAIVKATTPVAALTMDDLDPVYSSLAYADRFRLVEDALIAWPAMVEETQACPYKSAALADGWQIGPNGKWINARRNDGASYSDMPRAFRYICEDYGLSADDAAAPLASPLEPVEAAPAATHDSAPHPAAKPRYRYNNASGAWEVVPTAPCPISHALAA